jgi:mannose-6-phosphate isomerase-like protein (cupin superfamily)
MRQQRRETAQSFQVPNHSRFGVPWMSQTMNQMKVAIGRASFPHAALATSPWHSFDVSHVAERLAAGNGGYEVVHESSGIQIGVYVLVAPEPDRQQPHEWDEVYVVLEGRGTLQVEGEDIQLEEGGAAFVKAGAEHRFVGYEGLSLLVVFDKTG